MSGDSLVAVVAHAVGKTNGALWLVIEVDGFDFDAQYSLEDGNVFSDLATALGLLAAVTAT